jgi:hypothetical protein
MNVKVMLLGQFSGATEENAEEAIANSLRGMREYRDDNRTEQFYGFAGEMGGVIVCNVDSAAELDEYIWLNPMSEYVSWEVHNISTLDDNIRTMEKMQQHMQTQRRAA